MFSDAAYTVDNGLKLGTGALDNRQGIEEKERDVAKSIIITRKAVYDMNNPQHLASRTGI